MTERERAGLDRLLGTVGEAMTVSVVTLTPEVTTSEAIATLQRHGVGGAPVVEGERVIGVVTVSDLARLAPRAQATGPFLRPPRGHLDWSVRDVMTQSVIAASAGEPLVDAIVRMDGSRVDRLPVVDPAGRPVGILAREDVVRAVAEAVRRARTRTDTHPDERRPVLLPD